MTPADAAPPAESGTDDGTFRAMYSNYDRAAQLVVAGGLVAAIVHDLRQPLTALEMNIAAALHFLRPETLQLDDARDALRDALDQHARMRESLKVLEDLSVHREPLRETIELLPIVHDVVVLVNSEVVARHASLELDVSQPLPPVFGDATLMRQALLNIVLDALEASSLSARRHKPVCLTVRHVEDVVEVAITHYGLRTEAALVEGWGLALARSVVMAHQGTIALEGDAEAGVRLVTRWPTIPHPTLEGTSHA